MTSKMIGVLRRLKTLIPIHAKLRIYKTAIFPHLTYIVAWCGISAAQATQGNWRGLTREDSVEYSAIGSPPIVTS